MLACCSHYNHIILISDIITCLAQRWSARVFLRWCYCCCYIICRCSRQSYYITEHFKVWCSKERSGLYSNNNGNKNDNNNIRRTIIIIIMVTGIIAASNVRMESKYRTPWKYTIVFNHYDRFTRMLVYVLKNSRIHTYYNLLCVAETFK